jgi:hypothetical protein
MRGEPVLAPKFFSKPQIRRSDFLVTFIKFKFELPFIFDFVRSLYCFKQPCCIILLFVGFDFSTLGTQFQAACCRFPSRIFIFPKIGYD